jgi:hypothetical protein
MILVLGSLIFVKDPRSKIEVQSFCEVNEWEESLMP